MAAISRKKQAAVRNSKLASTAQNRVSAKTNKTSEIVEAVVATQRVMRNPAPKISTRVSSDGRVRIRHREFVSDIFGSVNYNVVGFSVNPGLATTFPWLNIMAVAYESYKFLNLSFHYETLAPTTAVGTVMMAADFDPTDNAPDSKTSLMSYQDACRGPIWGEFNMVASSGNLSKMKQKFLRFGNLPAGQNVLLFDACTFYVATQQCANTSAIGELYVEYDVELITPQLDLTAYAVATAARAISTAGTTVALPLGSGALTLTGGVPIVYDRITGATNLSVPGQYLLSYSVLGTGLTSSVATATGSAGTTVSVVSSAFSATSVQVTVLFKCVNTTDTITLVLNGAGTITSTNLRVAYYATLLG